jgi:diguanylate cyclase (GGDEF)-like protein
MLAERLRAGIEKLVIEAESTQLGITVSIGVAAFPEHGMESELLLQAADSALYRAKLSGRNRVAAASI